MHFYMCLSIGSGGGRTHGRTDEIKTSELKDLTNPYENIYIYIYIYTWRWRREEGGGVRGVGGRRSKRSSREEGRGGISTKT